MPISPRDIREQLLASNPEYQQLVQEHSRYNIQIEQLSKASFLSGEDLIKEAELKKRRLRVKDEMEHLVGQISRARAATAR